VLTEHVSGGGVQPDVVVNRSVLRTPTCHSVSISQGGFNMAYTAGVLDVVHRRQDVFKDSAFLGVSTGAVVACCICTGMPPDDLLRVFEDFNAVFAKYGPTGWHRLIAQMGTVLDAALPDHAHELCSGRLVVGVTCVRVAQPSAIRVAVAASFALIGILLGGVWCAAMLVLAALELVCSACRKEPVFIANFHSKAHLIHILQCSCSIPLVQDGPRLRKGDADGRWFVDGGLSMRHLVLEETPNDTKTIKVDKDGSRDPQADVAPSVYLPSRVVTPPDATHTRELFCLGAADFEQFLQKRGL
jgi:hypothetical protein